MQGRACLLKGPHSRITATRVSLAASLSTTALTKCWINSAIFQLVWDDTHTVVPIVTEATSEGLILACSNIEVKASLIPELGFVVVGALCLLYKSAHGVVYQPFVVTTYHATMPLLVSDAFVGSKMTPSVLVLGVGRLAKIRGYHAARRTRQRQHQFSVLCASSIISLDVAEY